MISLPAGDCVRQRAELVICFSYCVECASCECSLVSMVHIHPDAGRRTFCISTIKCHKRLRRSLGQRLITLIGRPCTGREINTLIATMMTEGNDKKWPFEGHQCQYVIRAEDHGACEHKRQAMYLLLYRSIYQHIQLFVCLSFCMCLLVYLSIQLCVMHQVMHVSLCHSSKLLQINIYHYSTCTLMRIFLTIVQICSNSGRRPQYPDLAMLQTHKHPAEVSFG